MYLKGLGACSLPTQQIGIDYTTCVRQGGTPSSLNNGTQTMCNYPAKCDVTTNITNNTVSNANTNANIASSSNQNQVNPNIITAVNTQVNPNISPNMSQQASSTSSSSASSSGGGSSGGQSGGGAGGPTGGIQYGANGQMIGTSQIYQRFGQPVPGHSYSDYFNAAGEAYYDPANKLTYAQWAAKQQAIEAANNASATNAVNAANAANAEAAGRAQFAIEQAQRDAANAAAAAALRAQQEAAAAAARAAAAAAGATPSQQQQAATAAIAEVRENAPLPNIIPTSENPNPANLTETTFTDTENKTPWALILAAALGMVLLTQQDTHHVAQRR